MLKRSIFLAIVACHGDLQEKLGNSAIDGSTLMGIPPPTCTAPATNDTGTGDCTGTGKPGDDCLMCHHQGGGATPFTFAGTVYALDGATPSGGVTIVLQDEVGNIATAITYPNGNFFSLDGFVMFPAKAFTALCPNVIGMPTPVDSMTGANCNTAGCHSGGFRIHDQPLP